jgi:hypothetical protein
MLERSVETTATPHVTVDVCRGSLTVRKGEEDELRLLVWGMEEDVSIEGDEESLIIVIPTDGTLICPAGASLTVDRVLGNLRVEGVEGTLTLGGVHGNISLSNVGPVALEEGLGNLIARDVLSDLRGGEVKGNARIHGLQGKATLKRVAGNLVADDLQGGLNVERVRGNVLLGPTFPSGATYSLKADGNLRLRLLPDASLRLALRAAGRVRSLVPDVTLETADGETMGTLGAGEAAVDADVGGNVTLRAMEPGQPYEMGVDLEGLGARIEWQVNEAMAELATRLESSLALADTEPIRRRVEQATEQARRKAEQAAERARIRAERAERRWQRASGAAPRPKPKPASDEERLRVLRMVEEGRLTPEQASDLLAALEGE